MKPGPNDCQWTLRDGRLHCARCEQPDYPPLDPKTGAPRWPTPADPAKWPLRNCRKPPVLGPEGERAERMGPGTELKRLLKRFGIAVGNCQCEQRALLMDQEGPDWCEEHSETIIDWLAEAAKERGLPFVRIAGKILVTAAVRAARRKAKVME